MSGSSGPVYGRQWSLKVRASARLLPQPPE